MPRPQLPTTHNPAKRDVSPVGASRFERPYSPPRSHQTSATTSPTTPLSSAQMHFYQQSHTAAFDSVCSHDTVDTAPTSLASDDHGAMARKGGIHNPTSPICEASPDDWLARFHHEDDDLAVNADDCPDRATLAAVQDIPIYDAEGRSRPFGSLYDPQTATHQRQLIVFVRHFYCGACQAYLRALTEGISMREYFTIPIPTSIVVIGCGRPSMLPHYKTFTGSPFPMFAEPSRALFRKLGMTVTLKAGRERPAYMRDIGRAAWVAGQVKTIRDSLRDPEGIRKRDIFHGGHPMQVGGEFLFEDGQVIWCHRMRHYRDHTEIAVLRKLLELDE